MVSEELIQRNMEKPGDSINFVGFHFNRAFPAAAGAAAAATEFFCHDSSAVETVKRQIVLPDIDQEKSEGEIEPFDRVDIDTGIDDQTQ